MKEEIERLQTRIAELERSLAREAREAGPAGAEPEPWPDGIDPRFQQDAIVSHVNRALREIGFDGEVTAADCTEYPCLIFGEGSESFDRELSQELRASGAMSLYENDSTYGFGSSRQTDDGLVHVFGIAVHPRGTDEEEQRRIRARLQRRFGEMQHVDGL